jgi:hypothetical protein
LLSNASNATIAMVGGITDIYNDDTPILNIRPRTGPREGPAGEVTNAVFESCSWVPIGSTRVVWST